MGLLDSPIVSSLKLLLVCTHTSTVVDRPGIVLAIPRLPLLISLTLCSYISLCLNLCLWMLDKHVPVSLLRMFLYICLTLTWMLDKHVAHSLNFSTISVSLLRMFLYICLTHSNLDVWQLSLFISLSIPLAVSLPLCLCLSITWMVAISVYP